MPRFNKEVRELIKWAEQFGWKLDHTTGTNHPMLSHQNGERYPVPQTASDYRSAANTRADLLRIAGHRNQSGPAAKYKRARRNPDAFNMDAALRGREQREENLLQLSIERLELRIHYFDLLGEIRELNPRRDTVEVHRLAAMAGDVYRRLRSLDG